MKEIEDSLEVPVHYTLCLNNQCPKADTCLRQIVERKLTDDVQYMAIVNPKHLATLKGDCPFYRSNAKVLYAKGMKRMLDNLSQKQMRSVVPRLIRLFSKRTYYRIRNGERLLAPSEQRKVLDIMKACGATETQKFDAYEEMIEW